MTRYISLIDTYSDDIVAQCTTTMSDQEAMALDKMLHETGMLGENRELAITEETPSQKIAALTTMIEDLISTNGVYIVNPQGPDGYECPWCYKLDADNNPYGDPHEQNCLKRRAEELLKGMK